MFNAKDIAYSTSVENLTEGQLGIFAEGSTTSIANTVVTFAQLPARFNIVSKVGGKIYYSFDTIEKAKIRHIKFSDYVAETVNSWSVVINHCECVNGFQVNVGVDEDSLIRRDGLTWTHRDFIVGLTAEEIDCHCADGVLSARDNNVVTKLAVEKINGINSPYYEAAATLGVDDLTTYADDTARDVGEVAPDAGDLVITTSEASVQVYDGSAWVNVASVTGEIADIDTLIAALETVNSNASAADDVLFTLVVRGKAQAAPYYADIDVNYVYPRGVKLHPSLVLNDSKAIAFTEDQGLVYEQNAGYDLRAEEWELMNYYTNLNYYTRLSDGITAKGVVYQFENGKNYDVLNFEFFTDKVEANNGDKRLFGVLIATETGGATSTELENMFTA